MEPLAVTMDQLQGDKEAIVAAVSHRTYKLKWMPPDNRSEVSQAFVEAVAMMDTASTTAVSYTHLTLPTIYSV